MEINWPPFCRRLDPIFYIVVAGRPLSSSFSYCSIRQRRTKILHREHDFPRALKASETVIDADWPPNVLMQHQMR